MIKITNNMKIELSFSETEKMIESKTDKKIQLSHVDDSTIKVVFPTSIHVPFVRNITKNISMNLSVDMKGTNILALVYDGGIAVNGVFTGALNLIEDEPKFNFVEKADNHQLYLHLDQLEQLRDLLTKVDIESINVIESGFSITCKLKEIL